MRLTFITLTLLAVVILVSAPVCAGTVTSFTFTGTVNGNGMNFTVSGEVGGTSNIWSSGSEGTIWVQTWTIGSISSWAILPPPVPSTYPSNETSFGQLDLSNPTNLPNGFMYHESLSGYDANTLEYWSHALVIRLHPSSAVNGPIENLIGIADAFTYSEVSRYAANFSFDNSTTPTWISNNIVSGSLTLTSVDYHTDAVPEPSEFLLLGIGLGAVCLVAWRFKV